MKILWALEPFIDDTNKVKALYSCIKKITPKDSTIEVGYVANRNENQLALAFNIPIEKRFTSYPKELIKKILTKAKSHILESSIFIEDFETLSTTKSVDRLLSLAKSRNSELLVLFTHSRKGIKRLITGSFAETVLLRSQIDLLIANPNAHFSTNIKNITYCSDFSDEDWIKIERVMELAAQMKATLHIFHSPRLFYKWAPGEIDHEIDTYRRSVETTKNKIEELALKSKISCHVVLATEIKPIAELALKIVKKTKSDLIVLSAKSSALTAYTGGSTTRQIVRMAHVPVLILK